MEVKEKDDRYMHSRLPINENEKILAIYRHHWFAYASVWLTGLFVIVGIVGIAEYVVATQGSDAGSAVSTHKSVIFATAGVFSAAVALFTIVPVYLKWQEQVVLTEEALLQILQPSIFASKISQLNLQHIADVSVRQDFFGTILGYGKISVETPGEQDNYEFLMIPKPQEAAKQIIGAHENYQAALQAGRMPTTLGIATPAVQSAPAVDPQQYQQFLAYQQMVAQQQGQQAAGQSPVAPQPPAQSDGSEVVESSGAQPEVPTPVKPAAEDDDPPNQ